MKNRQAGETQAVSAAKSGISCRSGRRIESQSNQTKKPRHWKTRKDPIADVWVDVLVPLLENEPKLTGLTLWEYLDDHFPGQYPSSLLRTLQRRVKHWRATQGPTKPVMFRQDVPAGQQGLSDFTHPDTPITIAGKPFPHLIYQFRLAYSGWRYAHIVQGGESYSALAEGLQNALFKIGGTPREHRTDSLSAAYVNQSQKQQLTDAYQGLCAHYQMTGTTNNVGVSHENGAIETAHASLKHRIDQAIRLRENADFKTIGDYQRLINRCVARLNQHTQTRIEEEIKVLQPLPDYRFMDYQELSVKVTTSSTISVKNCLYSVPSQLIGETLRIHLYHDKLIGFVGLTEVFLLTRIHVNKQGHRGRRIDYRHVIHSLAAKPQAFRYSRIREDLFPDDNYRQLWVLIDQQLASREACKWIVTVLRIAADHNCASQFGQELLAQSGQLPDVKTLQTTYLSAEKVTLTEPTQHDINDYDQLLSSQWANNLSQGEHTCH